jgi:triphosphoribosyl-dephospho-CoA synthase
VNPEWVRQAYLAACELELQALKPGNVHVHAGGHHMEVDDFRKAAAASAEPLTDRGLGLGERIYRAVEASRRAVPVNTNLGIVLLCAPLAEAAMRCGEAPSPADMQGELRKALAALDRQDTDWAFRAIALANPGGLGDVPEHDVRKPAGVTLLDAMKAASGRDRIAAQYATGFFEIFHVALPPLRVFRKMETEVEAAALLFLFLLATVPDSHLVRKFGQETASIVLLEAKALLKSFGELSAGARREPLLAFDAKLKQQGLNPGTTADYTVATLFLQGLLAPR